MTTRRSHGGLERPQRWPHKPHQVSSTLTRATILVVVLLLVAPSLVYAQGAGLWIVAPGTGRPVCTTITNPVTNQSWCFDAANGSVDYWNGSAWIAISGGGGGGAPVDATYLLVSPNATLTNARQYLPGTNMNSVDSGAGGTYTLNLNNAVSLLGPPVITIAPTGNPGSTLTTLSVQSSTSSTSRVFQGAFGLTSTGGVADKVALYAGAVGNAGTFDLWSFNTVLTQSAASGSYNAQGAELDINNLNANRGTADAGAGLAAPVTYGLSITGASTFSKTAAILISENAHMWNRGIVVANDSIATTGSSFQDLGNPGKVIDIRGHPTYGFFQDQPDVLNQAQGGMILGPFATPGGLPTPGHAGRAAYSISDTSLYCDNGAAWVVCNVVAGGSVGGSGTVNFLPVWTGSSTIGNSLVLQSANRLTLSPTSATTQTISAGFAAAGAGAELNLLGGIAAGASGAGGGNVFVGAGAADGAGTGGTVSLQGGNGGTAGGIIIQSGNATAGNGEAISITGGTGTGHGADLFLTGGASTAGTNRGGGVFLQGGNGFGGGATGVVDLQSGGFVMTPTSLLVGFGQGTASGNTSINLNLKGNSTVSGNQSLLINLEGNGTLSDTKTFTVLSNNADLILLGDGVTPMFDAYVQASGGTIWGEVNVSPSSTGMNTSLGAADAATTTAAELDVTSPNAAGGASTGAVRILPWGTRTSSDGKVTELRFYEADITSGKYVGFKAPDPITTTTIWKLPVSDGSVGTCLSTNGGGVLAWANCSSGGTGLTSLNGQTGSTQTFAKVDDTNVTLTIASSANVHTFTMGWAGTLAAGRLNANVVQGVTNDTNVTGSISAQNLTLGWTGTLAAGRLNANVVQGVTNDTNVTGVISAQNLTLGWTGTLGVARGGTGLASGTSGGIPAYTGATTITSSALLTNHAMVVGGGAGAVPKTLAALTNGQLYIGSTGVDPVPSTLTCTTGVSCTPGAGTITITATGGTGTVTTTGSPANGNLTKFSGATSITNGDLSGDVTTAGTLTTTIAPNSVTFAKMQTIPTLTLMSNLTGGAAVPGANTLSQILDTVLGATQGSIIYRDSGAWAMLVPGTSGFVLQTQGPAANPIWAAVSGTGSVTHVTGPLTANAPIIGNGGGDIKVTAALTNGQILIGATGGAPVPTSIASSSLTFTPGAGSLAINTPNLTANGVVLGNGVGSFVATAVGPVSSVLQGNGSAPVFTQTPQVGGVTTTGNPGLTLLPFGAGSGNTGEIRFRELSANGVDYAAFKGADSVVTPYVLVLPNGIGLNGQALSIINQTVGPPAVATMGWLTVPSTTPFTGTSCGAGTAAQVMSAAGQFTGCIPVTAAATTGIQTSTFAGLPAPGTVGATRYVTDNVRGLFFDSGVQWFKTEGVFINIENFGAKGDNSTDNATTIAAAVAACPSNGCTIFIPAKSFRTSGTISASVPLTIRGEGRSNNLMSRLVATGSNTLISKTSGETIMVRDVELDTTGIAIVLDGGVSGARITNVGFVHCNNCVSSANAGTWVIDNSDFALNTGPAVLINNAGHVDTGDNAIVNSIFNAGSNAIASHISWLAGGGLRIIGNKFLGTNATTSLDANLASGATGDFNIIGNSFEAGTSFAIRFHGGGSIGTIEITGNGISTIGPLTGISIEQSGGDVQIVGNKLAVGATAGISITGVGIDGYVVSGNTILGDGASTTCITVGASVLAGTISGNHCSNAPGKLASASALTTFIANGTTNSVATLATLPASVADGSAVFCSNCTLASPCGSGGSGAFAKRYAGQWVCN